MKILVKKVGTKFMVDPIDLSGSPQMGFGSTMDAALGDFLRCHQERLGVEIILDETAQKAEKERQRRELSRK